MPIQFSTVRKLFYHRKGDPVAEQRRLLEERERIEKQLAQFEAARKPHPIVRTRPRSADNNAGRSEDQHLKVPTRPARHVSWSDGFNSSQSRTSVEPFEEVIIEMPLRLNIASKRRNAMGQRLHRKSLMQGILSVASGEGRTPASELKEGKKLPRYLTSDCTNNTYKIPDCCYKPLPDPDEFYENKTYIAINQQGTTFRFSESKSLFLFGRESKIRQSCINLFIRPVFSHFIMLVILANCVCMMQAEPPAWIETHLEYVFTGIYCFEAAVKIIGRGFVLHRFAYLRDPWNWLDFVVIIFAIGTEIMKAMLPDDSDLGQFSVLRAFRVLRALKTMSVVPGLRGIVKALLRSIRALQDAVCLTVFCVSVFALIGYQLFHGTLRNKCVLIPGYIEDGPDALYLADWNISYATYHDEAAFVNLNAKWTIPSSSLYESNITQQYNSSVDLPFSLTPLFLSGCSDSSTYCERERTHYYENPWMKSDTNLTKNMFALLNETLHNESLSNAPQTENFCDDIIQQCIVRRVLQIQTDSYSSLVQEMLKSQADINTALNATGCQYAPVLPVTSEDLVGLNNVSTLSNECNVSVLAFAGNITCMHQNLALNSSNHTSAQDHQCYEDNIWIKTLAFGENHVTRWSTRKLMIFFQLHPFLNSSVSIDDNLYEAFGKEKTHLIFEEYSRKHMTREEQIDWNCADENYVMRKLDSGMYFYTNSSNRPSSEPLYCRIGYNELCGPSHECLEAGGNPDSGYTNYDSFFWAFLTSFRLINQDAWSRLYYLTLHTSGQTYAIFYIVIMFLGSYYLINLILAVVYMAYEEQQAAAEDEALEEEEHKAEIRDFEAVSNTEDEVKNSGEDDNGSRSSIYAAAEEGRHTHHLITTSLTSIADSSVSRRSRRGSRRSRYGHRRPHVKVDPQSALLYRKFTEQHGDGLLHDSLSPDDRSVRTVNRLGMSRQNSQISIDSHGVFQGKEVPYCAQCQQRAQHERSQSTSCQPDGGNPIVVISPDTPIATTENPCNYSFLSPGGTPKPVGTTLKNSTLDVLAVDFGRPPSIYSTGSEGNYELDNDVFLKPGNVQNGDVSNGLRPIPGMARMNDNGGFLVVPFDGVSQSTFSVSSNSDTIDGEEQVVQADVNSAAYLLGPPPSYTESIIGSQRSINLVVPSPAKPPETKKPALPLQVPSLMVTAASTEHILGLEGLQERRPSMDSDIYKNGYCKPRLPAILGSPDGDFNNDIPMDTRSEARLSLKRNNRRNRGSIRSTGSAYESNHHDQSRNAINSIHASQHRMYDETKFGFSEKERTRNENRINGCHDNAGLTSIAANMENIEDTKLGAKKRMTKWARNAKLTAIEILCKWSCCTPRWELIQGAVRRLVLDPFMDLSITICIFLNTMFMMMEYHPQDDDHVALLERANFVFTMIFAGEMLLKVVGLGPYTYFIETWNVFDAVVVVSSLLEILLQSIPGLSVLRAFRLMRILKLAKSWPTLNKLLRIIGKTLGKLWHLTLVFLLVLFIFAVVGMQLLRDYYKNAYEDHMPRWNFVDFPHAFLVVFRIQCGEWIENMFACMSVAPDGICIPLFILVLVIGNLVILNLFLALLLNSFSGDALQRIDPEINSLAEARGRIVKWFRGGAKAVTSCELVTNCCSKLRLQLCYGKRTTVSRSRRIKVEKTTKENHLKKSDRAASKDLETEITNVPVTSDAHENNNHSIIINEKANLKPKIHSVPNDRNMLMLPSCYPHLDKNNDDVTSQYSEDPRSELEFKYGRHHRNRQNNLTVHRDDVSCRSEKIRQTESSIVRCRGCNRTFRAGTSKASRHRRRQKKINDGFKPAIEFQNRPDEASDDVSSNRTDEESSLHPPRTPFQAYGNIEYTRTSVRSRTKSDEGRSSDGEKRKRSNTGRRSRQHSDGSDTRNHLIVTGNTSIYGSDRKLSKHSDQEETDSLLKGSRTSQLKRSTRREKRGSTRRKSHETVHSSHTNNSSHHQQHHNRTGSAASSEAESEAASQAKKEIQYCFPPCWIDNTDGLWWKIRKFFYKFARHGYFEHVVIFCILASSIALAFEDIYLDSNPAMKRVLQVLDKFFCAFFAIEMLIKWVGYGLRFYFTNAWCLLDFVIVFISLLDLFLTLSGTSSDQLGTLRVLRTFRALRPLRALSRFQGMKVVVDALVRAIPSIFNVFLVCVIVWLIFSILGVNLFGGRFGRCVMTNGTTGIIMPRRNKSEFWNATEKCDIVIEQPLREDDLIAVLNKEECIECNEVMGNNSIVQWYVPAVNFDHVGQGFLSLMQVATFKGWLEIMGNAADITEIDGQPEYEHSMMSYFYFCIFIVFGAFFSLNLFIGVIIDNFNQQKVKSADGEDGVFLTDEQKRYYNAMKKMASKAPSKPVPRPANPFSNFMYTVVTDRKFEIGVMTMIILNMVVMAIEHYGMSPELDHVLQQFNLAFIVIFSLEATMKIIGLRWDYFRFGWNLFDFFVVVVSIIVKCLFTASALSDAIAKYFVQPTLFRIIRLFRVTRILRLIREAKGIRTLLFALMMSLPALFNIGSLLFLVIFIYAILGMSQFAYIKKTGGVDDILNFETFPNTFLVLFQVSTSEGWNTFIEPILSDDCDPDKPTPTGNGDCGNPAVGVAYFVTFVLMTFLIVINMYIAIILENFEVATRESAEPLTADDFEQFFEVWQRFDDKLTQYVTYDQLQHFLHQLDHPLRVPFPNRAFIAHAKMRITPKGKVHCMEVIIALIKKVLGDSPELYNFKEAMLESFMLKCKTKQKPDSEKDTIDTLTYTRMMWAATVIQGAYRKYKSMTLTSESSEDDEEYVISKLESEPG